MSLAHYCISSVYLALYIEHMKCSTIFDKWVSEQMTQSTCIIRVSKKKNGRQKCGEDFISLGTFSGLCPQYKGKDHSWQETGTKD